MQAWAWRAFAPARPRPGTTNGAPGERTGRGQAILYVLNDGSGTVTPILVARRKAGKDISVGGTFPSAISVSPDGRTVYVAGQRAVIPIMTGGSVPGKPISVSGRPGAIAFTPDGKTAWVLSGASKAVPINVASGRAGKPVTVATADDGAGEIAITRSGRTAFFAGDFHLVPLDLATSKAAHPIRYGGNQGAFAFSGRVEPGRGDTVWATVSGWPDVLRVTSGSRISVRRTRLVSSARQIAVTPNGRTVFVSTAQGVVPIDAASGRPGRLIRIRNLANDLAVAPDGRTLYVAAGRAIVPVAVATGKPGGRWGSRGRATGCGPWLSARMARRCGPAGNASVVPAPDS